MKTGNSEMTLSHRCDANSFKLGPVVQKPVNANLGSELQFESSQSQNLRHNEFTGILSTSLSYKTEFEIAAKPD